MSVERKGFVYYKSFYESMKRLPDDEHFAMYKAVCEYALYGAEPCIEDVHMCIVFDLTREQIDANNRRYENGKKGGAPAGNKNAQKGEAQPKTTKNNQKQPKEEDKEEEKEAEKGKEKETDIVQTPAGRSAEDVQECTPEKPEVTGKDAEEVFATLWALYPSKKGKGRISVTTKKKLAKIGVEEMTRAIERYTADLAKDGWRKPQNGSTFFNSGYIDYLDKNWEGETKNGKWNIGVSEI